MNGLLARNAALAHQVKISPGKIDKLQHVTSADKFNNEVASKNVADALFLGMTGDAVQKFECQGDTYTDKGFKMLSVLKKDWDSSSTTQIFKERFSFFQAFPQGEKSPDVYEKDLCLFVHNRNLSGNPMSIPFQVMSMVQGLRADYGKILRDLHDGTK